MEDARPLAAISDDDLLRRLADLSRRSRRVESELIAHIAEVEERRLYAREASPSMFAYCTQVLNLSEAEAYARITVARASREHPMLLDLLADGRIHLTGIARLVPYLTLENRAVLLARATRKSRRQIEELIAEIAPRPDAPALIRKLPLSLSGCLGASSWPPSAAGALLCPDRVGRGSITLASETAASLDPPAPRVGPPEGSLDEQVPALWATATPNLPAIAMGQPARLADQRPALIQPLGSARYKIQFTARAELRHKLARLQALLRSQVPDGDLAAIVEMAVTEKLERLEARRFAVTRRPRKSLDESDMSAASRSIPAAVRRAVYERDGGRCRYVDAAGRRCSEHDRPEFHHRRPFGMGGDHSPQNIRLMCRAHNRLQADHDYGHEAMARRSRT